MDCAIILLLLLLSEVKSQDVTTPSSLLRPRNFNHHPYDVDQPLNTVKMPEASPTKQGPVLFPNDGPPPPPSPLIVTSRPLIESIARSELNSNNTVAAQSQINGAFLPAFLGRDKAYRPFGRAESFEASTPFRIEYDYETESSLPPIYEAISDHAQQNVQKVKQSPKQYDYQVKQPVNRNPHQYNDGHDDEASSDYNHGENYAFSYTVKDQERGDDFSHSQQSSGSATNGEYRVRLPDGRMQIVSYTADENGYNADVRYDDDEKPLNNVNNGYHKTNYRKDNNKNVNQHIYKHQSDKHNNYNINTGDNTNYNTYNTKTNPVAYVNNNELKNDYSVNEYNDNSFNDNAYKNNANDKQYKVNTKDYYGDISKEYFNDDYSSEYNVKYEPHNSKYTSFLPPKSEVSFQTSTIKPSYDELKNLFTKELFSTRQNYNNIVTNIPYTTPSPQDFTARYLDDKNSFASPTYSDEEYRTNGITPVYIPNFNQQNIAYTTHSPLDYTTERTVLIGGKRPLLFTDIKSSIPSLTGSFVSTTPGYLVSTVSNSKNNFKPPILSNKFIDKIQKYLSFK